MTPDEVKTMHHLCLQIQVEQDREIFMRLVRELNALLSIKQKRIDDRQQKPDSVV